jgi:hypothetical protein
MEFEISNQNLHKKVKILQSSNQALSKLNSQLELTVTQLKNSNAALLEHQKENEILGQALRSCDMLRDDITDMNIDIAEMKAITVNNDNHYQRKYHQERCDRNEISLRFSDVVNKANKLMNERDREIKDLRCKVNDQDTIIWIKEKLLAELYEQDQEKDERMAEWANEMEKKDEQVRALGTLGDAMVAAYKEVWKERVEMIDYYEVYITKCRAATFEIQKAALNMQEAMEFWTTHDPRFAVLEHQLEWIKTFGWLPWSGGGENPWREAYNAYKLDWWMNDSTFTFQANFRKTLSFFILFRSFANFE